LDRRPFTIGLGGDIILFRLWLWLRGMKTFKRSRLQRAWAWSGLSFFLLLSICILVYAPVMGTVR
jgi:hypothetical protein